MRSVVALFFAFWTTTVAAQVPFGRMDVVETRFGSLQVLGGEVDNFIFFNGLTYQQLYGTRIQILASAGLADAEVDWALIEAPQAHGVCDRMHRLLAITASGLSASSPFGPCNGQPTDMQILPGQVQVTLVGDGGASGTYTFNGQELHEGPFTTAPAALDEIPVRFAQSEGVNTRFGRLWVQQQGEWEQVLMHAGAALELPPSEFYWFRGLYPGAEVDYVIASSNHSGNMCGGFGQWFVLEVSAEGVASAPPLDACRGMSHVRVEGDALVFDMGHGDLGISHETFTWDGATLSSVLVPEAAAAPAGPGEEVTRWIGRNTWEVFQDASERARMGSVMSPDQIQALAAAMSFGSQFEQRGDWVISGSCQRHNCGFNLGVLALRITDGAVAAAVLRQNPTSVTGFGPVDDPVVATFIAEHGS